MDYSEELRYTLQLAVMSISSLITSELAVEGHMWHAVTPVSSEYDPIVYEGPETAQVLVLNAGPGVVLAIAWPQITPEKSEKSGLIQMELRPGAQRILSGSLVRVKLKDGAAHFAAVAWRILRSRR